ncbi:MAG TPA: MGMT family protein [Microbacteriaceae bacterium]|nr:MGMT family protein [Microbacteriaceae bacterium]
MPAPDRGFAEAVLAVVDEIPSGQVMSYGDVAAALGSRAARAVGQVMAYYGQGSPWWRVLRAGGHPPRGLEDRAREFYVAEGTPLITTDTECGYRVDFARARYRPWR